MTTTTSGRRPQSRPASPWRPLQITLIVLVVAVAGLLYVGQYYADFLWFDQLGYSNVLVTQWIAIGALFVGGFLAMAVPVWLSLVLAWRSQPVYVKLNAQLERYRELVDPLRVLVTWGLPIVLGFFAGVSVATRWTDVLVWWNSTPTTEVDPQFGLPISFYLFELPFWRGLVTFLSAVVLLAGLANLAIHVLYGGLRFGAREFSITTAARVQLAIFAALYVGVQAVSLWLDQYATLTDSSSGLLIGASYTDVNAWIPGRVILVGAAVLVVVLFLVAAFTGRWRLPVVGTGLLLVSALVVGNLYPWAIQRFQVDPSEQTLEAEYLKRNIEATRKAYGVDDVVEVPYAAKTDAEEGALRADAEAAASIRLIDPQLVSAAFTQFQVFRQYYQFPGQLDVGRYEIDGETQDVVLAVRELNSQGITGAGSWVNQAIVYTHGYGLVAAYGNKRTVDGQPLFLEGDIPVTKALGDYEPRIYFGENSPRYSIVGGPAGTPARELDYPSSEAENASTVRTTFSGDGGPKLSNILLRIIYAIKFQSEQILLSGDVYDESQILYDRDPLTRVGKVAPYLTLDSDPYPAIVDGRIVWIVDGYTTSANYPYSAKVGLRSAMAAANTQSSRLSTDTINYIRNSVKATVDAYDGKVTLYAWDDQDPVLQTWNKVFPGKIKSLSEMSGELMSHVRYPSDLFKVQRTVLGTYHVTNPEGFYEGNDAWVTPREPTATNAESAPFQPPYYLSLKVPGQDKTEYSIYSTYIPQQTGESARNVLMGYLSANSNAGNTAGTKSPDYGKLTLLTLPKDTTVPGPGQVQANFNSNPTVATELNLLERGQSTQVLRGNLLTLPVGGGLLYVQPVYVQATGGTSYPLLRKVLVAFGDEIAFKDSLGEALDEIFGGDSGAGIGDGEPTTPTDPTDPTEPGDPAEPGDPGTGGAPSAALKAALADAAAALKEREAALKSGDLEAFAKADARLQAAIEKAIALSK